MSATAADALALDAVGQAELVRRGEVSAGELVEAAIERLEEVNPALNAVIHPLYDKGRAAAGSAQGPLAGVPMVLKDLGAHSAGDPHHSGMALLRSLGWTEPDESELVRRFRAAGLVIVAKTNTPELGLLPTTEPLSTGPTHNPWDTSRTPFGSSGGSAAAVAVRAVAVGHANDAGGSIRMPASACGVVGLKPTRGRITLAPDAGDALTGLIHEGFVTRSVRDTAAVLDLVAGGAPGDPYAAPALRRPLRQEAGADPGVLRIGVCAQPPAGRFESDPECAAAAEAAGRLLESLGHAVVEAWPPALEERSLQRDFGRRMAAGGAWEIDRHWPQRLGREIGPDDVEPSTWAYAEAGRGTSAAELFELLERQGRAARSVAAWWAEGGFDLLVTPTVPELPPPLGEFAATPEEPGAPLRRSIKTVAFTAPFNVTGQPAISLPLHWTDDGLAVGVQLVAAFGREDVLIRVGAQLEQAAPWADRRPPV